LAGFASTSEGNLFPATIADWNALSVLCNNNGATLKDTSSLQGYGSFAYEAIPVGPLNEPGDYYIIVTVSGVPDDLTGSTIEIRPSGIMKWTS
jgi:hypothetical protein